MLFPCRLPGITRDSVLQICRARDDVKVSERTIRVIELREAAAQGEQSSESVECGLCDGVFHRCSMSVCLVGRLVEAFGTGTA
eukprot:7417121-Ditylum_brightwellii.AAC.1